MANRSPRRLSDEALARLEELTDRFYDLMGSADESTLAGYCARYVEAHPEEFFLEDRA